METLLLEYEYSVYLFMAKTTYQAGRYKDMYQCVYQLFIREENYSDELIFLFELCFKNVINPLRLTLRKLRYITAEGNLANEEQKIINQMMHKTHRKLIKYLMLKDTIDFKIENITEIEKSTFVFLKRVKADFLRYSAENTTGDIKEKNTKEAVETYQLLHDYVLTKFKPVEHERLGVVLNYSVFLNEFVGNKEKAIEVSLQAYNETQNYLDMYNLELCDRSKKIDQIIQRNVFNWQNQFTTS